MGTRHAAALLCGAAAVHLADLAFHAGRVFGLSGFGEGRALVVALAAVPAVLLAAVLWDRSVGPWAFLAGACAGYATDEWWLLPAVGWWAATAIWALLALVGVVLRRRAPGAEGPLARAPRRSLVAAGALTLGAAMGFVLAIVRPTLFQHVAGTRHGLRIAVLTGLVGLLAGGALGQALKSRLPRWGIAAMSAISLVVSFATTAVLLPKSSGGLVLPLFSGEWTSTWWGRSLLASWAVLGLTTVAFGLALPLLDRRALIPFVIGGICAGTWFAESRIAALDSDPAALLAIANDVARHPPLQQIEAAAIDPDGIWTRYRTRTLLEIESIGHWQGTRMDRGELWVNLERAEVEPATAESPSILGRDPGELGLHGFRRGPISASEAFGDRVLRSCGWLPNGVSLRDTREHLERERRRQGGAPLRAWCDPRALTPAGLRSLLGTWREALPDGRFLVLVDGYSGPLLGVRLNVPAERLPIARELTVFEAPIASAFRGDLGPVSTLGRPILEWLAAPEPSPFMHPRGDVMRALVDALAVAPGSALEALLHGLVIHAEAQVVRPYVVSAWDHVAVPEAEIDACMAALRIDESAPAVVRHLQIVLEVLYKKREYALLVRHGEEAVARRPDVLAFHRTLGKAYHDILDYGNAIEELTQAHALDPAHHDVAMELSRALAADRRWADAAALLESELERSADPAVLKGLAVALLEGGDPGRAEPILRDLNARFPADVDVMRAIDRLETLRKK